MKDYNLLYQEDKNSNHFLLLMNDEWVQLLGRNEYKTFSNYDGNCHTMTSGKYAEKDMAKRLYEGTLSHQELSDNYSIVLNSYIGKKMHDFELNKGISGILRANGEFHGCINAKHGELLQALGITEKEQGELVYFSSLMFGDNGSMGGVVSISPYNKKREITEEQAKWISLHFLFMDSGQKEMLKDMIKENKLNVFY